MSSLEKVELILQNPDWQEKLSEWIKAATLQEIVATAFLGNEQAAADPYSYFDSVTSVNGKAPLETPFFSSRWYNMACTSSRTCWSTSGTRSALRATCSCSTAPTPWPNSPIASISARTRHLPRRSIRCGRPNISTPNLSRRRRGTRSAADVPHHILVFGNHYEHKGLFPALTALAGKGFELTVFGAELARQDIKSHATGQLSDQQLAEIWDQCDVLVFPSFYEGFGFPVLESVARRKPIVLLETPLNRALHRRLGSPRSFFFFSAFRDLPEIVAFAAKFIGPWPDTAGAANDGWRRSAREIAGAIRKTLDQPLQFATLKDRIASLATVSKPIA